MKIKLDKKALAKAVVITAMSWAAVPVLYYIFSREKKKDLGDEKEDGVGETR